LVDIVHGDLKPENVLIFQDERDVYCAKVSDFGYSTRFSNPDDVCPMPRSRPWDAPEHHFNMFTMSDARKMDIFSFGLVCCWILFEKYLARVATLPASLQWAEDLLAPKNRLDCSKESISELKRLRKVVVFAEQLLITNDDLEAEPKEAMLKFLRASLIYEQDLRSHDLHTCFHYFVPG
jgi:serine/threonine protein kinase